ncbi:MAG: hypothetical protein V7645_2909 [Actinomycetota bacterium]
MFLVPEKTDEFGAGVRAPAPKQQSPSTPGRCAA